MLRFLRNTWSSVVIVALVLLRITAGHHWTDAFLPPGWLPTRIVLSISIAICLGVLLAQALHSEMLFQWLYAALGRKWSAPTALVAVAICLYPQRVPMLAAFLATTALVGACVIREDNGLSSLLQLRPIAYMGVLSYGMYLFNSLSIHAAQVLLNHIDLRNPLFVFPAALGSATIAAHLSYRYFESHSLKLKARFTRLRLAPTDLATDGIMDRKTGIAVQP